MSDFPQSKIPFRYRLAAVFSLLAIGYAIGASPLPRLALSSVEYAVASLAYQTELANQQARLSAFVNGADRDRRNEQAAAAVQQSRMPLPPLAPSGVTLPPPASSADMVVPPPVLVPPQVQSSSGYRPLEANPDLSVPPPAVIGQANVAPAPSAAANVPAVTGPTAGAALAPDTIDGLLRQGSFGPRMGNPEAFGLGIDK